MHNMYIWDSTKVSKKDDKVDLNESSTKNIKSFKIQISCSLNPGKVACCLH